MLLCPRPIVHILSRGPDETGGEDRWGVLSQSQIPDPAGMSALCELLLRTSWANLLHPHRLSSAVSMCLASDLLCWNADWFPKGVCDLAQRSDRQLLRGVWIQVCAMIDGRFSCDSASFPLDYVMCVRCAAYSTVCVCKTRHLEKHSDFSVCARLLNPFECPYNSSRRQDCDCRNDYSAAGYTLFHKVRLDLSSLRIMSA